MEPLRGRRVGGGKSGQGACQALRRLEWPLSVPEASGQPERYFEAISEGGHQPDAGAHLPNSNFPIPAAPLR